MQGGIDVEQWVSLNSGATKVAYNPYFGSFMKNRQQNWKMAD